MKIIILLLSMFVSGCGSISTLPETQFNISHSLKRANTNCNEIPQIYSGVAYDICAFNSNPDNVIEASFSYYKLIDTIPSAIIDTVALPYTIYLQYDVGSIEIK